MRKNLISTLILVMTLAAFSLPGLAADASNALIVSVDGDASSEDGTAAPTDITGE
jgi:hypothetical protein